MSTQDAKSTDILRRLTIATSWDHRLLRGLAELNEEYDVQFDEVYGAFQQDTVGSARHAYRLPAVTEQQVADYISAAERFGIGYAHLLNAPELDGDLSHPSFRQSVVASIECLAGLGVQTLTIANDALVRLVREAFGASFHIKLSLIAGVDSIDSARAAEDLGVDVIILSPFSLNRDFESLRAIRAAVGCEIELYANISCLQGCPVSAAHYRYLGRTSHQSATLEAKPDPYLQFCSLRFLDDPVQLLRSPFIRPEDLDAYYEIGIDRIKLSDRAESTDFLLKTAEVYARRSYHGDLFSLVFRAGSKFRAALDKSQSDISGPSVTIDNDTLGRLEFLDQIRTLHGPELESFYRSAAEAAVEVDAENRSSWISKLTAARNPASLDFTNETKESVP